MGGKNFDRFLPPWGASLGWPRPRRPRRPSVLGNRIFVDSALACARVSGRAKDRGIQKNLEILIMTTAKKAKPPPVSTPGARLLDKEWMDTLRASSYRASSSGRAGAALENSRKGEGFQCREGQRPGHLCEQQEPRPRHDCGICPRPCGTAGLQRRGHDENFF